MILERKLIELTEIQQKILKSGWGNPAVDDASVEKITYLSDDINVKGYLAYPKFPEHKLPCIIWNRGGFGNAGTLDNFHAQGILGQLASWGFVVFASQYRGNVGGEGIDEFGGNDLNDIFNLIPLADELEFTDSGKWGIEGWSRGGMMTYLALTRSKIFNVAISIAGISNLSCTLDESNFMKKLFDVNHTELDNKFCEKRTILNMVDQYSKNTPTLLIHGTDDKRIPPHHSLDLSYKFLEFSIEHRLVLLENGDHFLRNHKKEIDEIRRNWLNKYLK